MPNRNYINGYNFERKIKKKYEALGYFVVRSAGSHGAADLVAIKKGEVLLIQCKNNGVISDEDRNKLWDIAANRGAEAVFELNR